jgi:HK97 family phage major capsid protein
MTPEQVSTPPFTKQTHDWTVGDKRDLPIADTEREWDGDAARARVYELDEDRWKDAFLLYDASTPELRANYKLPIADVVDGDLMVIPSALRAAASMLQQTDAPEEVLERARAALNGFYERLREREGKSLGDDALVSFGGNIKAVDEDGRIGGYLVLFGDQKNTDLEGDFFTKQTDFGPFERSLVFYHHGQDATLKRTILDDNATLSVDDVGVWIEAQLDMRNAYEKEIFGAVKAGKMGWSSGTLPHLIDVKQWGNVYEIKRWYLGLDASITPIPAEPKTKVVPLKSLQTPEAQPEDANPSAGAVEQSEIENTKQTSTMEAEMSEQLLEAITALQGEVAEMKAVINAPPEPELENTAPVERDSAIKAVHQIRFGDVGSSVKAVLNDLYGRDYEIKRVQKTMEFNRWLRDIKEVRGPYPMRNELILTPEYVRKAVRMGMDVKFLKSTMVEAADELGGYTVPVDFQEEIISRLMGMVVMRNGATIITTTRDRVERVKVTGGNDQFTSNARVTWVNETPTAGASETNLTFGLEGIPVHTVMAETPMSRNLLEDSAFNLSDMLAMKFAESFAIDEDNQFILGDGNGKPQGVLPGGANSLGLTEVNSGNATAVTWDGLIDLSYGIASQYKQNAVYIGERATWSAIAKLQDGGGQYLWKKEYGNNVDARTPLLEGFPTLEQEIMPTIAANAYPLIFGDRSGYYIVDRIGMSVERFLDSTTARQNLVYFVARSRKGGQVAEEWKFAVQKVSA